MGPSPIPRESSPQAGPGALPSRDAAYPQVTLPPAPVALRRAFFSPSATGGPPSQIREGLYLGSYAQASDAGLVARLGITHVINVTATFANHFEGHVRYLRVPIEDRASERAAPFFAASAAFIEGARADGGSVLVHCQHGISRSATIMVAYLMRTEGLSLAAAFASVRAARPEVEPNAAFMRELRTLERELPGGHRTRVGLVRHDSAGDGAPDPRLAARLADVAAGGAAGVGAPQAETLASGVRAALAALAPAARIEVLAESVRQLFEQFGGSAARDGAARAAAALAVAAARTAGTITHGELVAALDAVTQGPAWAELCLDVPHAPAMVRAFRDTISGGP